MDKKEFMIFAKALKTYFPKDNLLPSSEAMELWFNALNDVPYASATLFLQKWIRTEKWSPTIADIRSGCAELVSDPLPDWGEAWNNVKKAVSKYGFMNGDKARKFLSAAEWKAVEGIGGWIHLCESEDAMSDRANFRQCYEIYAKREQQDRQIPDSLKESINALRLAAGGTDYHLLMEAI